jgi:hypothetical protein
MKKLILLALIYSTIALTNCKKTASPTPAAPAAPSTPTPTYTMTATETALVGDWIWDKTENYSAGVLTTVITPTTAGYVMYAGAHIDLKSTLYLGNGYNSPYYYNWYAMKSYFPNYTGGAAETSSCWWVENLTAGEYIYSSSSLTSIITGYIKTVNFNTLITQTWVIGQTSNGKKSYYHK